MVITTSASASTAIQWRKRRQAVCVAPINLAPKRLPPRLLAARLELGATNAYLGVLTAFKDPALGKLVARLAADEAAHFALLNFDLKRPFSKALAFGA